MLNWQFGPVAVAVGLMLTAVPPVLDLDLGQASAQDPTTSQEEPVRETEGSATGAPSAPATEESSPRPFLRRGPLAPRPLTPEEHEEAERLKKLAAMFGTDPTAIVGRVQFSATYYDLPQEAQATTGVARVDLPFRGNWLLRTDVPFLQWTDPNRTGVPSAQGVSDLLVLLGWRAYNTPEYAVLLGMITTFPTASETQVGLGKYTLGPLVATARFLPRIQSFLFGVFQYQTSVGGDPSRQNVSVGRALAQINTIWTVHWWTIVQGVWQVDWERNGKSSMTAEFELGRNLVGGLGMYVRPGVGVWGQSLLGAYDWNVEAGVRLMFRSF